ncbi:MAG TPA: hypothetical protein VIN70_07580 [Candidatus Limnocylindria bacterium]|jgi:hypothetical protein
MFKTVRALVIAVVIAVSLIGSASVASADTIEVRASFKAPPAPALAADITWE